ncbi:GntR family transcriptional regulator [Siculibacillus lacustris]|uniref:GntR family transcriptional regulator n=1 Tax=Siculibacillus lacustris TaxID=1549641 RepID=A0A4Q9VKW5_9HYPH|nr:GntR family transcriptional regulator [Siculibacillus lacustris]TBW36080.1 GntR family transcriptional regulator [Siculibacillus lacustris]
MNERVGPIKQREKAYARFTKHLLARDVRPGQFVSQRELVELTGMPLGAIREIIPRLEVEGLIKTVPQRGMQVAHVDFDLIREAFQFRLFLEREAVAVFTREASDAELAALRAEHEAILAEALSPEPAADLEDRAQMLDWGLHDRIIDSLGNSIISKAYRVNSIKQRLIAQERSRIVGRVVPVMREHLEVVTAMQARDGAAAVDAITRHIAMARELILRV